MWTGRRNGQQHYEKVVVVVLKSSQNLQITSTQLKIIYFFKCFLHNSFKIHTLANNYFSNSIKYIFNSTFPVMNSTEGDWSCMWKEK